MLAGMEDEVANAKWNVYTLQRKRHQLLRQQPTTRQSIIWQDAFGGLPFVSLHHRRVVRFLLALACAES